LIVGDVRIFEAERPDRINLRDVLTGLSPVEMPRISGKHKNAAGRIRGHGVTVEFVTETDVENARNDRVDAIFRILCGINLASNGAFTRIRYGAGSVG
jgi:hypothetical protein